MDELAQEQGKGMSVEEFWNQARECHEGGAVGGLVHLQRMAIASFCGPQNDGRCNLVGSSNRREVEDFLHPGSYRARERLNRDGRYTVRRGSGAGRARIFTSSRAWEDVLVVPFSSEPGKIVGMAFADAYETCPDEFIHRSFVPSSEGKREAGFAMLPAANSQSRYFGNTVFVLLDLLSALRLQFKRLVSSGAPLPILVARDEDEHRTALSWRQLRGRQAVIIAEQLDARLFRQAYLGSARVVIDPSMRTMLCSPPVDWPFRNGFLAPEQAERIFRWSYQPIPWLQQRERLARPWTDVLIEHLGTLSPQQGETLLQQIGLSAEEQFSLLRRVRKSCRGQNKWRRSLLAAPRIRLGDRSIVEWDGAWIDEGRGRRICDVVRVDRILEGFSMKLMDGRVIGKTDETRFTVNAKKVERRGLLAVVKSELASRGIRWPVTAGWSKHGLAIAKAFQGFDNLDEVDTFSEVDVVGSTNASFRFPNLQITAQGFRSEVDPPFIASLLPAGVLQAPSRLHLRGCRPIAFDFPAVRSFWAVMRIFLTIAMAPTLRIDPPGAVLVGSKSQCVLDALQSGLGSQMFTISARVKATHRLERLRLQIGRHRWPSLIQFAASHSSGARLVDSIAPRNCLTAFEAADRELVRGAGWWLVDILDGEQTAKLIGNFGRDVALNYLQSYVSRRFDVCFDSNRLEESLWEDVSNWYGKIGRGRDVRIASTALISRPAQLGGILASSVLDGGNL